MLKALLVIFIILWLVGLIHVPFLYSPLFVFGGFLLTLQNLLYLILILFLINFLSGTFRTIAIVLLVVWLLSNFGFFVIAGLSHIILLLLILAVIFSLV